MGPQKFGNPDTNSGKVVGATGYTGKGCLKYLLHVYVSSMICHDPQKILEILKRE
jgi:hypothetical protein